ncbi:MAG: methyltransferase domain-containing protein [Acidobacteria bacterium]|nr:methyltransferase domain-containing protein [Acidobacteriota bacterium]
MDLGAGVGIHGFIAARLGAERVYSVESQDIIALAERIANTHEWGGRLRFIKGSIEDVELPEPVDIIISVFTGNFLLEEDLLPSLFFARDKYLKPGGVLIPSRAKMVATPVSAPDLYQREIARWSEPYLNIDFGLARKYAANSIVYDSAGLSKSIYLADPGVINEMDFLTCQDHSCQAEARYSITESGICHGLAGWFDMLLGEKWLSTDPHQPDTHWNAVFLPLDPPIELRVGDELVFKLARPAYGEWSWWVQAGESVQSHSTTFSAPVNLESLGKYSIHYRPKLSPCGQAWLDILSRFDGNTSLEEMTDFLLDNRHTIFRNRELAVSLIKNLVTNCA